MSATTYLIIANSLVWIGIAGYLGFLASRASELKKREQQIELLGGGDDS
ncbi:CcmD family protein [Pseudodesulfovibrio sp. zrk46]|nr:CcmD family protein [Pseudodesulfovibrio sp. zrk46]QJB57292.1 CcmD family protein [Pseudodesulfovibrio sp. zrk46]